MMSRLFFLALFVLVFSFSSRAQEEKVMIIKPGPEQMKDAFVVGDSKTINYGSNNHLHIGMHNWSNRMRRVYIDFEVDSIPTAIEKIELVLFASNSGHSIDTSITSFEKTNFFISRVIDDWEENTITWENQPTSTSYNQVAVNGIESLEQINKTFIIDITDLFIEDFYDGQYGFVLRFQDEGVGERRLEFASSDNTDVTKHPELRIFYKESNNSIYKFNPGKVFINSDSEPSNYDANLIVGGKIVSEGVKIAIQGTTEWPDYVFDDGYQLSSLDSVNTFITQNRHLPNVPSAEEIDNNGLELTEINIALLRKIEELTLYLIENEEKRKILEAQNKDLENRIYVIESKMDK